LKVITMSKLAYLRPSFAAFAAVLVVSSSSFGQEPAAGDSVDKVTCAKAHTEAQVLRKEMRLVEAQQTAQKCMQSACPVMLQNECVQLLEKLERQIPSLTFDVRLDSRPAENAKVFVDGLIVDSTAAAHRLNPGEHKIRVELEGFDPVEQTIGVTEGQQFRAVQISFKSPEPETPAAGGSAAAGGGGTSQAALDRPIPVSVYVLGALGGAAILNAGVWWGLGLVEENNLRDSCYPRCKDSELDTMKTRYRIGDISLGVGLVASGVGLALYLTRPTVEREAALLKPKQRRFGFDVVPTPSGVQATTRFTF
jgi:hypothetical protein